MRRRIVGVLLAGALLCPVVGWGQQLPPEQQLTLLLGQTYLELVQARATMQQQTAQLQSRIDWWQQCASSMSCVIWLSQGSSGQPLQMSRRPLEGAK